MIQIYNNFLQKSECSDIQDFVLQNRTNWLNYNDLWVYGNSYKRHLLKSAFRINPACSLYFSHKNFECDWLYNTLIEKFSKIFKCQYSTVFAKPGFQIVDQESPRVWHYDDEIVRYPYHKEFPDYKNSAYFDNFYTMVIMISDGKFTFDYYPQTFDAYKESPVYYCAKHVNLIGNTCDCDLKEYKTINYQIGDLLLIKNRYLHRIGLSEFIQDARITLNGNIVEKQGIHYLYW
jgi:hypothetical protein